MDSWGVRLTWFDYKIMHMQCQYHGYYHLLSIRIPIDITDGIIIVTVSNSNS